MMTIGMLMVVFMSKGLLSSSNQSDACKSVQKIKAKQKLVQIVALVCIALELLPEMKPQAYEDLFLFIFSFIANVTLLTLVMSDLMLGMIRQGQLQANAFSGTPLEKSLNDRLKDLEACGLTDLKAGEAEFAAKLRQKSGFLRKQS